MKKETEKKADTSGKTPAKETTADLATETSKKDPLHKGYNEKNPAQPQGAFPPDSKDNNNQ